jgi:molybdenum cofactor biosynthesis enzyme MoaA
MPSTLDLLGIGLIREIRLDLTSRCNLRCVYCPVSHKSYVGKDMSEGMVDRLIAEIVALHRFHPLNGVDVNGHGETTYAPNWWKACFALIDFGIPLWLTSNLAKSFTAIELEALGCMQKIVVSIDSADHKILRRIRRRVDLKQIVLNVSAIRATALRMHRLAPMFAFQCGLYDQNTLDLPDLARLAVVLGVRHVSFWNLFDHGYADTDVAESDRVLPLDDLDDTMLRPRLESIDVALRLLRHHDIQVAIHGDFIDALRRRVGINV